MDVSLEEVSLEATASADQQVTSEALDESDDEVLVMPAAASTGPSVHDLIQAHERAGAPLYIMLSSFHHTKGPVIEMVYPRLNPGASGDRDDQAHHVEENPALPAAWAHLPFLTLPDGLHNHHQDTTFFTVPALKPGHRDQPQQRLFGVACSRQIETERLAEHAEYNRNTVMKALTVLSPFPVFKLLESALAPTLQVLFEQRALDADTLLVSQYQSLTRSFNSRSFDLQDYVLEEVDVTGVIIRLRHRVLQVLICSTSSDVSAATISQTIVALAALVPGMLTCLHTATEDAQGGKILSARSSPTPAPDDQVHSSPDAEADAWLDAEPHAASPNLQHTLYPYTTIQQLPALLEAKSCLMGTTNAMMTQHSQLADVVVDLCNHKGNVSVHFMDDIIAQCEEAQNAAAPTFAGSPAWCCYQFTDYILRFLAGVDFAREQPTKESLDRLNGAGSCSCLMFNINWKDMRQALRWSTRLHVIFIAFACHHLDYGSFYFLGMRSTHSYARWCRAADKHMRETGRRMYMDSPLEHPCRGALQLKDIGRRARQFSDMHFGPNLGVRSQQAMKTAVETSSRTLTKAFQSSKQGLGTAWTSVSNWWNSQRASAADGGDSSPAARDEPIITSAEVALDESASTPPMVEP
ncbi:uncharacterized protein MONBRDRAFT_6604 [Monosiga brevicollis MX1]|uniref:AVL9/DENND6 domain-containing protein n=1 Tax=Monosiga brevicollis TaxID=81824 RepID=A9UUS1_MONBE|nr:uncharacterized protein MONBRDRAFT_6604 [Monosiga brevicollis MX1]EDQ90954.1 predicted protein [Monosiga brevicollis MX1]|eukprot:XP_001744251.1 hypothetical protein [Monosiga brevicollis MX1]